MPFRGTLPAFAVVSLTVIVGARAAPWRAPSAPTHRIASDRFFREFVFVRLVRLHYRFRQHRLLPRSVSPRRCRGRICPGFSISGVQRRRRRACPRRGWRASVADVEHAYRLTDRTWWSSGPTHRALVRRGSLDRRTARQRPSQAACRRCHREVAADYGSTATSVLVRFSRFEDHVVRSSAFAMMCYRCRPARRKRQRYRCAM